MESKAMKRIISPTEGSSELPHPILTIEELERRIQHDADMEQDYEDKPNSQEREGIGSA